MEVGDRGRCGEAVCERAKREGGSAEAAFSTTSVDSATQAANCCRCMLLLERQPDSQALTEDSQENKTPTSLLFFLQSTGTNTGVDRQTHLITFYCCKHNT